MKDIEAEVDALILELSDMNPGALNVLLQLVEKKDLFTLLFLNLMEIKGSKIWYYYKDSCEENLKRFQSLIFSEVKARSEPTL